MTNMAVKKYIPGEKMTTYGGRKGGKLLSQIKIGS
jgi:hypothetical protein